MHLFILKPPAPFALESSSLYSNEALNGTNTDQEVYNYTPVNTTKAAQNIWHKYMGT